MTSFSLSATVTVLLCAGLCNADSSSGVVDLKCKAAKWTTGIQLELLPNRTVLVLFKKPPEEYYLRSFKVVLEDRRPPGSYVERQVSEDDLYDHSHMVAAFDLRNKAATPGTVFRVHVRPEGVHGVDNPCQCRGSDMCSQTLAVIKGHATSLTTPNYHSKQSSSNKVVLYTVIAVVSCSLYALILLIMLRGIVTSPPSRTSLVSRA